MPENRFTPCVILPGIGQSKVELTDKKGDKIRMAWPPEFDGEALLGKLKAPLMKMMLFRKDGGFSDKVASIAEEIISPLASDDEGVLKNNLRVVTYPGSLKVCSEDEKRFIYKMVPLQGLSEKIGEENIYYFPYNSFGDPYETAALLDSFIEKVREETGSDKVNLLPVSLGGEIAVAYLDAYAHKNEIKRVMFIVAALDGTYIASDILGKHFSGDDGGQLLLKMMPEKFSSELSGLLPMMPPEVPGLVFEKLLDTLINTLVVNSPDMWGTVPSGKYEELSSVYLGNKPVLREKTDRYYKAQKNFPEKSGEYAEQGIEFFSICGYGKQLFPLAASADMSSDGIINVTSAAPGTVSAPAGEKLSSTGDNKHVSPDGSLDASESLWPERTWFFSNQGHDAIAYNGKALEIACRVLSGDDFNDIYSDEALPQFMAAEDSRK